MSETSISNIIFIKYFLIGDINTNKTITEFSTNMIGSKEKKNATQIFKRICKSDERRFEERNIINAKDNKYYFSLFQPNIVFIVYADDKYPDRLIFTMFEEIRKEKILSMINEETKELNPNGRQSLKQIIEKYQDIEKIDKIYSIQKDINDVKIEVKENLNKMAENVESIENLEEKANELSNMTTEYTNSIDEIRKINLWQTFKLWMPLFFVIIILFIIILCIIF
jgi:hypothetical protein